MDVLRTGLGDVVEVVPRVFPDDRGYFFESYQVCRFAECGLPLNWLQANESRSVRGVIRGIHYQTGVHAQAKLVRVVVGRIRDVAVDLRRGSPSLGEHVYRDLDDERHNMLFVPRGFGHGFSVLSDVAVVQYLCDGLYAPEAERGIHYADSFLNIDWGLDGVEPLVSLRDAGHPGWSEAELF